MEISEKSIKMLLEKIKQYDDIAIFRHESPDFDALGSQWGLYYFLKNNFKNKNIYALGYTNSEVGNNLFPKESKVNLNKKFLAIVLDSSDIDRVSDERVTKGDYIIKIDHHPNDKPFGNLEIVNDKASSASEVLYYLLTSKEFSEYKLDKESAKYLFVGIVGDSSGFETSSTGPDTLLAAGNLLSYGFDLINDVYKPMYNKSLHEYKINQDIISKSIISQKGFAYYILEIKDLDNYKMDSDDAKNYMDIFRWCDDIKVWGCFVYDKRKELYRVSLRSNGIEINKVAVKHNGGGHKFASGARAKDHQEIDAIIKEIEELI